MSKTKSSDQDMLAVAQSCIAMAKAAGAKDASARSYRVRDVSLDYREGKVEKISESTTRGVNIQLPVSGRQSFPDPWRVQPVDGVSHVSSQANSGHVGFDPQHGQ